MNVKHAVITAVNRDDMEDGGATHFGLTVQAVRAMNPTMKVEVLIPDFQGNEAAFTNCVGCAAGRAESQYRNGSAALSPRSSASEISGMDIELLGNAAKRRDTEARGMLTKSGVMLGLVKTDEEIVETMRDLRSVDCDILTLGQ